MALRRKPPWCTIPEVGLASSSCLLDKLLHLLPLPLYPKASDYWSPLFTSPQVMLGKKSLKTLPSKLPPLPIWLVTNSPIFSTSVGSNAGLHFSPYSAFRMLHQETGFCVYVCKSPSPGESLTFSLRKSWCHGWTRSCLGNTELRSKLMVSSFHRLFLKQREVF